MEKRGKLRFQHLLYSTTSQNSSLSLPRGSQDLASASARKSVESCDGDGLSRPPHAKSPTGEPRGSSSPALLRRRATPPLPYLRPPASRDRPFPPPIHYGLTSLKQEQVRGPKVNKQENRNLIVEQSVQAKQN
jgi:hypothetical protein